MRNEYRESRVNEQEYIESTTKDWVSRGFSCELWVDPPGQEWLGFVHETDELLKVIQGDMNIAIDGALHMPEIGEELFIGKGQMHDVCNVGTTTAKWLYGYRSP